jgi:hypothetical protein
MSFNFASGHLQQRIDRFYHYADYWIWAFPNLEPPIDYAMVLQDGSDSWACFIKGQNNFFSADPSQAMGYADPFLTDYLINTAQKFAFPSLLAQFGRNNASLSVLSINDPASNTTFPAIYNSALDITIILNGTDYLPYMIRTCEDHAIFGNSTNDLILSSYSEVVADEGSKLLLPHRFQTRYNTAGILEDFLVESITINPHFEEGYFDVPGSLNTTITKESPQQSKDYNRAEVHEFFETGLWSGSFDFNTSDVVITYPIPDVLRIRSVYVGYADYVQMLVEFSDFLLITDAPPHRSKILLQWISENIGKPVRYVAPSHHHHDHAYGIADYAAAGATLVVPEVSVDFYSKINNGNVSFVTFNETHPFILKDQDVQVRAFWHHEAPHARDWSYSIASKACPVDGDGVLLFNADVWSPSAEGVEGLRWDTGYARQWLDQAVVDGIPRNTIVVGAHGSIVNGTIEMMESVIETTGYAYPNNTAVRLC